MYKPTRDYRFEYIWDVMTFIEEMQCKSCAFKSDREDYDMCGEIEAAIITEQPVPDLDDLGAVGVICRRYKNAYLAEQEHPDQGRLIE